MMSEKTNAIRLCEAHGLAYHTTAYDTEDGAIDGKAVADKTGKTYEEVFKTLVTIGQSGTYYVFVVPVGEELDLKKAAKAVGEKFVEMIPVKDILKVTGYIKGGCSPIGMKKEYRTVIDETVILLDEITFSAGRVGLQVSLATADLDKIIRYTVADISKDPGQ